MTKTTFEKKILVLIYQDHSHFNFNKIKSELLSKFYHNNVRFTSFESNFVSVLNQKASKKSKFYIAIKSHI